ncbi:hypothetical protein ONZ45_g3724 [Pleurotus djamor]|nr:hypothetical protein ONZ45_g3724 [Pleurotus djamor]
MSTESAIMASPAVLLTEKEFAVKINAAFTTMRLLCEERNHAYCSTRKIPREILAMIFRILARERYGYKKLETRAIEFRIPVTHVCRQWRLAAFSDPFLWNNLQGVHGAWLEHFVSHSGNVPLIMEIRCDKPIEPFLDTLLNSPERISGLSISNGTNDFISRLHTPTPRLSALSLHGHNLSIPNNFLGGDAPHLQSFGLAQGSIPQNPTWILGVRSLTLSRGWGIHSSTSVPIPISLKVILEFIKPLAALESLSICLNGHFVTSPEHAPTVHFPNLRSINLSDLTRQSLSILCMFNHVETPNLHDLTVGLPDTPNILTRINDIQQHFLQTTQAALYKASFSGLPRRCNAAFSSKNDEHTLTFNAIRLPDSNLPLNHLKSLETLEVSSHEIFDFLATVPRIRRYQDVKHIVLPPFALSPKQKSIPAAKRWLKTWLPSDNLEDISVGGVTRQPLHDHDLDSLERAIPHSKRVQDGDLRIYHLK